MTLRKRMDDREIVFMYPGQGVQYFQMGKSLFEHDRVFRDSLMSLDRMVTVEIGTSLIDYVFDAGRDVSSPFDMTLYSNQAVFCFEYAMTQALISHGVYPDHLLGASLGELVCASVSGALSPRDCIALLADSARVMARHCAPGGMLAVLATPDLFERDARLREAGEIASIPSAQHFVMAGTRAGIDMAEAHLSVLGETTMRLPVEYGFHSSAIDPARAPLRLCFQSVASSRPVLPAWSCRTGRPVERYDAEHFDTVLRDVIDFKRTIEYMERRSACVYLDISPSGTLSTGCRTLLEEASRSETFAVCTPFSRHPTLDPVHWMRPTPVSVMRMRTA
ncbi:acyltransferase domain-containing protein (plasmid) [Burkholderia sp. FERM BP-3421]|nr:acyltransferase domain-containing protein [Burkholderia sp. FERM BP-3421]WDD90506.1 acyltransferase domain-containing protein [Burkholderia sp. FERM BP-3421]